MSCFHFTQESKQADITGVGEVSILPHPALDVHVMGSSLGNTLIPEVITLVETACKTVEPLHCPQVLPYQHHPPAKPVCLLVTPSLCLFLGQTNFFQVPLIIFAFHAKNKPCYPLCLEHPPTFQTILFFISALISKSSSFRWV